MIVSAGAAPMVDDSLALVRDRLVDSATVLSGVIRCRVTSSVSGAAAHGNDPG